MDAGTMYANAKALHELLQEARAENGLLTMRVNAEHIVRQNLETENAKLRELVRDMEAAFIHGPCYRWCEFKEPCNGDRCQYRDRMRELGVDE